MSALGGGIDLKKVLGRVVGLCGFLGVLGIKGWDGRAGG